MIQVMMPINTLQPPIQQRPGFLGQAKKDACLEVSLDAKSIPRGETNSCFNR